MKKVALLKKVVARDKSTRVLMKLHSINKQAALDKRADWMNSFKEWIGNADNQKKLMYGAGAGLGTYALSGLLPNARKHKGARLAGALAAGLGVGAYGDKIHAGLNNLWNTGSWSGAKAPAAAAPAATTPAATAPTAPAAPAEKGPAAPVAKGPAAAKGPEKADAAKAAPAEKPAAKTQPAPSKAKRPQTTMDSMNAAYDKTIGKKVDAEAAGSEAALQAFANSTTATREQLEQHDAMMRDPNSRVGKLYAEAYKMGSNRVLLNEKQRSDARLMQTLRDADAVRESERAIKAADDASIAAYGRAAAHNENLQRLADDEYRTAYLKEKQRTQAEIDAADARNEAAQAQRVAQDNAYIADLEAAEQRAAELYGKMEGSWGSHNGYDNSSIKNLGNALRGYTPAQQERILSMMYNRGNIDDNERYARDYEDSKNHWYSTDKYVESKYNDILEYQRKNRKARLRDLQEAYSRANRGGVPLALNADDADDFVLKR